MRLMFPLGCWMLTAADGTAPGVASKPAITQLCSAARHTVFGIESCGWLSTEGRRVQSCHEPNKSAWQCIHGLCCSTRRYCILSRSACWMWVSLTQVSRVVAMRDATNL